MAAATPAAQTAAQAVATVQQQQHPCYVYMFSHRGEASLPQLMMPQLSDNKRDLGGSHFDEVLLQFTNKVCSKVEQKLGLREFTFVSMQLLGFGNLKLLTSIQAWLLKLMMPQLTSVNKRDLVVAHLNEDFLQFT